MDFKHELVIPNEDIPFKMFLFEGMKGNYSVAKHWHRSIEIFAVMEGAIDFYINSDYYHLTEGSLLLVNSNEIHSVFAPDPNKIVVLQIPLRTFTNYSNQGYIRFKQIYSTEDENMFKLAVDMFYEYEKKGYGYELKVQSQFLTLIYSLITEYREADVSKTLVQLNKNLNLLSKVTQYLEDNYAKELSLEGVAKEFGFSPTYLSRIFQKYAKINYKSYLDNIRVEYAFKELVNTDNTISDIAFNNGFANNRSFSKTFLKRYGMLPSEYRKKG